MDPVKRIEEFQRCRARRERDVSITSMVRQTAETASRTHRRLGQIIDLWEQVIPEELAAHTRITAIRGGVLHISVDSASDRYEVDRLLRSGAEDELRRRYRGTLMKVRVVIG